MQDAPGRPGIPARWTSSDKSGVGTAIASISRVWFTLSHGILNECYYQRVDQACTRDFGFLVTDGHGFFAEEKRDTESRVTAVADGVPAYQLINTHMPEPGGVPRFRITKEVVVDPDRDVVLQRVWLQSLDGGKYRLFALLAPHLVNAGAHNTGWAGDYKGQGMLFAEGGGSALALAASVPWVARTVGFAGTSDGWQDISRHGEITAPYDRAADGNVALAGELALGPDGVAVLAMGFGRAAEEAGLRARSSLAVDFAHIMRRYAASWQGWQRGLRALDRTANGHNTYRVSTAVLRTHESPSFPGGFIASLSIPWGASKGDDDLGGYHLVWPRDLVQTAGGLLAAGANADALRVLDYLRATQEADGHWPQNNWLDGTPYWSGVQMDECAFPILLLELAWRQGALGEASLAGYWPMVRAAAGYILRHGPITCQDRWEENSGFNTYTLAVEIAALAAAADFADRAGMAAAAAVLRDTADAWNDAIEDWVYAAGTDLARAAGVDGYYLRLSPDRRPFAEADTAAAITIRNRPADRSSFPAHAIVSPDALALVRFGLRAARDPRIVDTARAIDHLLRVELPAGPCWYRYNEDGYGEHDDGRPFDGSGRGRLWPLLTGERAHYALAAGDAGEAATLLATMEACTSTGALLPEQVWDSEDIPAHELCRGRPSGSAMPLVWAHAEHIKLLRSLADGAVFDMPCAAAARYGANRPAPRVLAWRENFEPATLPRGRVLRVALKEPGFVHWSLDGWLHTSETATVDTGLGVHTAEIAPGDAASLVFTWRNAAGRWAGRDVRLPVV